MKKKILLLLFVVYAMLFTMSTYAQKSLPTISITTSKPLNLRQKVDAHMKTIGYDGPIGIKLRGNSSLSFNQKKYTIETRDADGKELMSLLGLPAHSDWVLVGTFTMMSPCCVIRLPSSCGVIWDTGDHER